MSPDQLLNNYKAVLESLPHRFPFLLIDRVTAVTDDSISGYKNITFNEPMFTGHFPKMPVYPGVYMIESSAQLAGIFLFSRDQDSEPMGYLAGVDSFVFKKTVHPGDQLQIQCKIIRKKMQVFIFQVVGKVEDSVAFQGELKVILSLRK